MPRVTDAKPVTKAGTYHATFMGVQERQRDDGEFWLWNFDVNTPDGVASISGASSTAFGKRSKAYKWACALAGKQLEVGEDFLFRDYEGAPCMVEVIVHQLSDGGEVNRVASVLAPPAPKREETNGSTSESGDDDIPF